MSVNITNIPMELDDYIFQHLDVADIYSLRLTCSALCSRTLERFKSLFSHINTYITAKSLRMLVGISSHATLAPAVKTISVIAEGYWTRFLVRQLKSGTKPIYGSHGVIIQSTTVKLMKEELAELRTLIDSFNQSAAELDLIRASGLDASLLSAAFRNLAYRGVKLGRLSLEAAWYKKSMERHSADQMFITLKIYKQADHVFSITMAALAESGLAAEHMQVFGGDWGCALSGDEARKSIERLRGSDKSSGLSRALGSLKSISMSFSHGMTDGGIDDERREEMQTLRTKEDFYVGPSRLLALAPQLEELSLLEYRMCIVEKEEMVKWSKHISEVCFPKLRKLSLSNLCIGEAELRHFLSNSHPLESIELNDMAISNGTWRPVFDDLSSRDPPLRRASFSYLYEGCVLEFDREGVVPLDGRCDRWRTSTMLEGEQIKKGIRYWLRQEAFGGSAMGCMKIRATLKAYGPPVIER